MLYKDGERFYKVSKILFVLTKILFWLTIVVSVGTLVTSIVYCFIPSDSSLFKTGVTMSIESEYSIFKYSIPVHNAAGKSMKPMLISGFLAMSISLGLISFICWQLKEILRTVLDKNPFAQKNSHRISMIGWSLIIGSCLIKATYMVNGIFLMNIVDSKELDVLIKLPLDFIFIGVLIVILARVFAYGNYLQDEYDATL